MIYRFGPFELDTAKVELRAEGAVRPLEPQVFSLLALLVENRERLVTTDELIEKIWEGRVVSDAAVSSRIKSARQALGDDGRRQAYLRTLPRQGFRFVADVSVERAPAPSPVPAAAEQPSIAVLPFQRIGDPTQHAAIAEGLPHDLITELARLRWLFVTARGSSFRLGGEIDPAEAGRLLGVRYCLSGTAEVSGDRLAVVVELTDTRTGGIVWAERFSGRVAEVHAFRAEITAQTLVALELRIPLHEADAAGLAVSENLDAWSSYHLGLQHMFRFNRADNVAAGSLFEQAVKQDPRFARAHAGLSFVHFQNAFLRHTPDPAQETRLARHFASLALDLDPLDPFVQFAMGRSYWLDGDLGTSLHWLERATEISPNYAQGIYALGWTETLAGDALAGRAHVDLAMRLSPLDPLHYAMQATRALAHLAQHEEQEAAGWAERAAHAPGAHALIAMIAAAVHAIAGNAERARAWTENALRRNPALSREHFFRAFPMRDPVERARVDEALKALGV
ncbi:MAG: winged helix-turn-helix domain-containing protein [Pseudomonadales bacterium]